MYQTGNNDGKGVNVKSAITLVNKGGNFSDLCRLIRSTTKGR